MVIISLAEDSGRQTSTLIIGIGKSNWQITEAEMWMAAFMKFDCTGNVIVKFAEQALLLMKMQGWSMEQTGFMLRNLKNQKICFKPCLMSPESDYLCFRITVVTFNSTLGRCSLRTIIKEREMSWSFEEEIGHWRGVSFLR